MKKYLIPLVAVIMLFSAYKLEERDEQNQKNIQISNEVVLEDVVLEDDLQSPDSSCEETVY